MRIVCYSFQNDWEFVLEAITENVFVVPSGDSGSVLSQLPESVRKNQGVVMIDL